MLVDGHPRNVSILAHDGDMGMVYRYDDTDRLTTMFTGADLYSTAIDTHVTGSGPTVFGIKRTWNLDPRGNRSGSQGVRDIDDGNGGASTTIVDTSVTVSSDKMNLYTSYAGKAYEFDACEQLTRDRSTETYHRYDWRGQLWRSDIVNSDVSDPERYYTYDCQGRRKTEVQLYKASPAHVYQTFVFVPFCACATGGCGGDIAGDFVAQTYTFNSAGAVDFHVEHLIGLGAHGTGSSSATHPAAVFGPGGRPAGDSTVAERVTKGAVEQVYWRYEDQLNFCVGQADENGWRRASPVDWRESAAQAREASRKRSGQNSYLAFGEVMQSRVLYDVDRRETGRRDAPLERPKDKVSRLSSVAYDGLAVTTITLANNDLSTDLLNVEGSSGARESEHCEREVMPRLRPCCSWRGRATMATVTWRLWWWIRQPTASWLKTSRATCSRPWGPKGGPLPAL